MNVVFRLCAVATLGTVLQGCEPAQGRAVQGLDTKQLRATVSALGRVETHSRLRRLSPLKSGVLETVTVSVGDVIERGQVIATLFCAVERAGLQTALASVNTAAAQLSILEAGSRQGTIDEAEALVLAAEHRAENTADDYDRQQAVGNLQLVSDRSVEQLRRQADEALALLQAARARLEDLQAGPRAVDIQAARAQVTQAKAEADSAQAAVDNCSLRAPLDGVVLRIEQQPGEFVAGGSADYVIAVADTRDVIVRAEVEERDLHRVRLGAPATLRFIGEKATYLGEVYEMAGMVGRQTARSSDPADRFDRDTLEVSIRLEPAGTPGDGSYDRAFRGFAIGRQMLVDIGS